MKVNRLSPDVYEVEDFVTVEQQEKILEFCKSLDESSWWNLVEGQEKESFFYGKQFHGFKPEVFDEIDDNVERLFVGELSPSHVALQRYKSNEAMGVHKDYWLKDLDYYIRYGIAIYYNDDYIGGEIEYPELGIVHKPKARSLLMHGGNIAHGTLPVKSDSPRYFSTTFIHGTTENPVVLNPELFAAVEQPDGSSYP
jgi:hypothetical protein